MQAGSETRGGWPGIVLVWIIAAVGSIVANSDYNPMQEYATVVSVEPAFDTTRTPRQVCGEEAALAQSPTGDPSATPPAQAPADTRAPNAKAAPGEAGPCLVVYDTSSIQSGFDVTYDAIRQTPTEIVAKARERNAHIIGLSILSGSHVPLVREVRALLRKEGLDHIPVVVGGIISSEDELVLKNMGVAAIYTPKDYALDTIMVGLAKVVERSIAKREAEDSEPRREEVF